MDADTVSSRPKKLPNEDLANESRSTHITVAADMVFSLSHHLSGVGSPPLKLTRIKIIADCNCCLCPCTLRRFLGGNPIFGPLTASAPLQPAKAGRNILLQHESHSTRVVQSLGHFRRTFQSSMSRLNGCYLSLIDW